MRKLAAGLTIGLGAAAVVLLLGAPGWLDTAELKTYDARIRALVDPASVTPEIVLVEIDDTSIRDFAPAVGRWPWPRALHAHLVNYLSRAPARVIALDLAFTEEEHQATFSFFGEDWTSTDSDRALVEAVRKAGNVILLADAVNHGLIGGEQATAIPDWQAPAFRLGPSIEERPLIIPPHQALADAAAGLGHNFLALDPDGPARRIPPFVRTGDRYMPSFGIAVALAAGGFRPEEVVLEPAAVRVRDRRIPLVPVRVADVFDSSKQHDQQTMLINYRAPALLRDGERPFPTYEVRHLLVSEGQIQDGTDPLIDPAVFRDKVVLVGFTASGLRDVFPTPFEQGTMSGIQLHASVADSLMSNRFLRPARDWTRVAATAGAATAVGLMTALLPFWAAATGALLVAAVWSAVSVVAFREGLWLSMIHPILGSGLALFGGTAYRYFVEDREKRKVKRLFGRYVSKDVYDQLLDNPALAVLGGGRRDMSVLFSDIRGFTTVTETGSPEELVAQLNEYFSRMVDVVFRHRGTVDKFVGDMVMALFGAPLEDEEHPDHAVAAAVEMVRELAGLNAKWASEGRPQLDIGIGVNSGEMIAGNIGSSAIMSYTVIGDSVNLGARLESLNKDYRSRIIISDATRARLKGRYQLRPLGDVIVKGKTASVAIFEVCVPSPFPASADVRAGLSMAEERVL